MKVRGVNLNTEIANAVDAADDKSQYDKQAKRLLAQKSILAHILVRTIDEFRGMDPIYDTDERRFKKRGGFHV